MEETDVLTGLSVGSRVTATVDYARRRCVLLRACNVDKEYARNFCVSSCQSFITLTQTDVIPFLSKQKSRT